MKGMTMPAGLDKDYQAESDCDTLMRAEEIKMDKKRLGSALKVAGEAALQLAVNKWRTAEFLKQRGYNGYEAESEARKKIALNLFNSLQSNQEGNE